MNCWPSDALNCCAINRAMKSVPPPGANGTMIFTGLAGYCCARTGAGASRATAAASAAQHRIASSLLIRILQRSRGLNGAAVLHLTPNDHAQSRASARRLQRAIGRGTRIGSPRRENNLPLSALRRLNTQWWECNDRAETCLVKFGAIHADELRKRKLTGAMSRRHPLDLPLVPKRCRHAAHLGIGEIDQVEAAKHRVNLRIDLRGCFKNFLYSGMRTTDDQDDSLRRPDRHGNLVHFTGPGSIGECRK